MICEFCNATMDERKIYGVLTKDSILITCSRCYPIRHKNQKTIGEYTESCKECAEKMKMK